MTHRKSGDKLKPMGKSIRITLAFLSALLFMSCGFLEDFIGEENNLPTSITITNSETSITIGETLQLNYLIEPADAEYISLSWTSNDPSIISVDENGLVTANTLGTKTISVMIDGTNLSDSILLTVREPEQEILPNNTIYDLYRGIIEYPDFSRDYRILDSNELNPLSLPQVGDVDPTTVDSEAKAISENHDDLNNFQSFDSEIAKEYIKNEILSKSDPTELNNTYLTVPTDQLGDITLYNVFFEEYKIYTFSKSYSSATQLVQEISQVMEIKPNDILELTVDWKMYSQGFESEYIIQTYRIEVDLISNTYEALQTLSSNMYGVPASASAKNKSIYDGETLITMRINEDQDDLSQGFEIVSANGRVDVRSNIADGNNGNFTSIHTDYYNANNELIAIAPDQDNDEDISLSYSNSYGDYIQTSPLSYSLKRVLPLKPLYSSDYELLSVVTTDNSSGMDFQKRYYLYKNQNIVRDAIPTFNPGDDVYTFINKFIDPLQDIQLDTTVETVTNNTAHFTWVNDITYFNGNSIATVETLKGEFKTLYDKYWTDFRNTTPDYSVVNLSESEIGIINSLK